MLILQGETNQVINFVFAGLFETDDEWRHPRRIIDTYEIIYVTEGVVYLSEGGEHHTLEKGDLYILTPGLEHQGHQASAGKTSFYWVHFTCSDLSGMGLRAGLLKNTENYQLSIYFKQLLHKTNTYGYPSGTGDFSLGIILSELYLLQNSGKRNTSKLVSDIIEWVRVNREKRITVENAAAHFNYNADYLGAVFKKHTNTQLKKYINSERLNYIKHIILTTNLTIKQIAFSLGWENENQFIHYFSYHEKISPAKLRGTYYNTHLNNK